jgi:hypothetical protein
MGGLNLAGDNMQSAGREDRVYFLSSVLFLPRTKRSWRMISVMRVDEAGRYANN